MPAKENTEVIALPTKGPMATVRFVTAESAGLMRIELLDTAGHAAPT